MGVRKRRRRVEPTDDWEQVVPLCMWPEQLTYEEIRPVTLFGSPVGERARQTGTSERTLYRRAARFEAEGMDSLFDSAGSKRHGLPPVVRRMIAELKAEHPRFSLGEIATICYVRIGRRPGKHTIQRVLAEEPMPLRMMRRFEPYHEIPGSRERRRAVVALHAEGWTAKAIAGYLKINRDTVYTTLKRWMEEGEAGLSDKKRGQKGGPRKAGLKENAAVRRLQENPNLGEFRVHAALARVGIHLSPRTCGRILAVNRRLYGLEKPRGPAKEKKTMAGSTGRCNTVGSWCCSDRRCEHGEAWPSRRVVQGRQAGAVETMEGRRVHQRHSPGATEASRLHSRDARSHRRYVSASAAQAKMCTHPG